jgi:hypothetical protein
MERKTQVCQIEVQEEFHLWVGAAQPSTSRTEFNFMTERILGGGLASIRR